MVKRHLKRIAAPKSWPIKRKGIKWVTRPTSGAHSYKEGMPINVVLREMLDIVKNTKELIRVLSNGDLLIDGRATKDYRKIVGLMDCLSIPKMNKHFRLIINKNGKLSPIEVDEKESKTKLCKIVGKSLASGKVVLNLSSGRNIIIEKDDYKVGGTLVIEVPEQKIKEYIKLEKGVIVYLISGKHSGATGKVEDISGNKIIYKTDDGKSYETSKDYAFVIGKEKPLVKIIE